MRYAHCLFYIVTSSVKEADKIVSRLLGKKEEIIGVGGKVPAVESKIVERANYIIVGHVVISKANKIMTEVKKIHSQKVPAISFLDVKKSNSDFLRYLNTDH